ncbi:type IVB secretion system protein IcmH/DotU [Sagittula salina]|uniref:Type IVB secretion system protein IcmH/DotU n=1 Tax=Sagittula salina TaxID=2820268 RepID=A0A940MT86_9RHOB|nr:type IVB secretion system protein IcmH/DotU [Sagittula salina]MBP0484974.1 type IVB secretion system protein IcmH/DotU [Sagittula salina]
MASEDDDEKTVFGQAIPQAPRPGAAPPRPAAPPPPSPTPSGHVPGHVPNVNPSEPDRTVFGTPITPQGQPPRVAPQGQKPPSQFPQAPIQKPPQAAWGEGDDTWLGGKITPQPGPPPPQQYQQPAPPPPQPAPPRPSPMPMAPQAQPRAPVPPSQPEPRPMQDYRGNPGSNHYSGRLYDTDTGRPSSPELFPEVKRRETPAMQAMQRKISLEDALRATGLGAGGPNNPLVAAAANLLILLGRLRTGMVEMQSAPLLEHVAREIDIFESNALEAGVPPEDVTDAKYALSATADDIVQNLPGADRGMWLEYSMGARFFGERNAGVGFFQRMDKAMKAPGQKFHLLDLMLTCLSLGFEGQYRAMPNGPNELARIRKAIYETLRKVVKRPDDDISVKWAPVIVNGKRRRGGLPVWVAAAIGGLMVVALFATLATLLSRDAGETQNGIAMMHFNLPPVAIERSAPVERVVVVPPATVDRLDEVKAALEGQDVEVELKGDWVLIRLGDALRFASGKADLTNDLSQLATAIGAVLETQSGPIRIVGHTDSVPPSGRGQFKTNEALSEARATTVAALVTDSLTDKDRVQIEGKGPVEPIADNASKEGRARNRRVEIMIRREAE